jgi:hypothetical protein
MGKRYRDSSATGSAGEYFVGGVVSSELGWVYRNQPIADIGIDGEIEVIDDEGSSTGEIVKVQVKSTSTEDLPARKYVPHSDFEYWRLLSVPVIVCLVLVEEREVYWRHASDGVDTGSNYRYDFQHDDALTNNSKSEIKDYARKSSFNLFGGLWQVVASELEAIARETPHPQAPHAALERNSIYDNAEDAAELFNAVKILAERFDDLSAMAPNEEVEKAKSLMGELARKRNWLGRNYEY